MRRRYWVRFFLHELWDDAVIWWACTMPAEYPGVPRWVVLTKQDRFFDARITLCQLVQIAFARVLPT